MSERCDRRRQRSIAIGNRSARSIPIIHLTQRSHSLFVLAMHHDDVDAMLLEKVDHAKGMARFYVISVEPTLFA